MTQANLFSPSLLGLLLLGAVAASGPALAHGPSGHMQSGHGMHQGGAHGSGHGHSGQAAEQTAWGIAGDAKQVTRTIRVEMNDKMRFSPDTITVKVGETIRFEVRNAGKVLHEMVIGTRKELDAHAEMMKKHPNMEHDEAYMAHVDAGKKGNIVWLFNREGDFEFACLIPGHYEAGMRGKIKVTL
jgi:uncharacterized cupredoxin-like copper-binding protein